MCKMRISEKPKVILLSQQMRKTVGRCGDGTADQTFEPNDDENDDKTQRSTHAAVAAATTTIIAPSLLLLFFLLLLLFPCPKNSDRRIL